MAFNLKAVLKALLFSSGQPLAIKDVQATFARWHERAARTAAGPEAGAAEGASAEPAEIDAPPAEPEGEDVPTLVPASQIREAMDQIAAELRAGDECLLLIETAEGYRLVTHPRHAAWVRLLRQEPPPLRLSQSSLETLAVVAYRQPVTRQEIETIRGVSAEAGLNKLLERELVAIVGRADQPGRPLQYGTTEKFLAFVGVRSLDELPASDVLSSRQIDDFLRGPAPGDRQMGLEEPEPAPPLAPPAA